MSDVIDLTDEPDAKRQDVDLSKDISDLGSDLMQKVFENLPLREQARAAMASKDMKGAYDVARGNLLADADGKLKQLVNYYRELNKEINEGSVSPTVTVDEYPAVSSCSPLLNLDLSGTGRCQTMDPSY